MSRDWGNKRTKCQCQLPPLWQKKTHHVLKGSIYWSYQGSQRMTKGYIHGIFLWPLRSGHDQIWLSSVHWRVITCTVLAWMLCKNWRQIVVCAHPGQLAEWLGTQDKHLNHEIAIWENHKIPNRCQCCLLLSCSTLAYWALFTYRFIPDLL